MQDANDKGIELGDKYVVNGEIELEKEPLILFFQSKNYSGKNGFSLQKVEYCETADYKNSKEIPIDEKSKFYEEETKRYKVTIPLDSMQEGKSYYFTLSFVADSGQGRMVRFCIKIKKPEVVEKPKSKEPTITAISANPSTAAPEDEVTLEVKAESPDGGTLSYQWYAVKNNSKEIIQNGDKSRVSYTIPSDTADGATLIFCVKVTNTVQGGDPAEKISENVTVTVKEVPPEPGMAQKPTFTRVLPMERTLKLSPGEKVTLLVEASSSIGNHLVFKWEECKDNEWTVIDERRYTLTTVNTTGYPKVFTMPNEEGWKTRKYRITVTNIIEPPLPDGTENSASRSVEFVVEEEPRKPMEYPEVTFAVQVKDENGEIYNIYNDRSYNEQKLGVAYLYSGESFTINALADVSDGGILSYKWKIWDYSDKQWKDVEGGNASSIQGRFDKPSATGSPNYYICTVTNTDPEGIKKAVSTSTPYEQLSLNVLNPLEFIFNTGNGQFADGSREKHFFIKPEILRTKDEGAAQYRFRLEREDFAQWMKEIGMHPDVIWNSEDSSKRDILFEDFEFLGWKYTYQNRFLNWNEGTVETGSSIGSSPTTFEAQWNEDHSLLEKMNTLIGMRFNTGYNSSYGVSVEAEKAEKADGKLKLYYNLEIEGSLQNEINMNLSIASNGKKQEFRYYAIYGITNVDVRLNDSAFKDKYNEDYKDYIGMSNIGFSRFMPVKNCMNAKEEDIAKFKGSEVLSNDKRFSDSPAGVFVCRYDDEHKYRVQFCFYADTINKTCGIEYFKMSDEDDPSRKCAIYIPCYGITNKGMSSTFRIDTGIENRYFSVGYGDENVFRIDFENEKIYRNIWVTSFSNVSSCDPIFENVTCPLVFDFDVVGISPDGMSLAKDNSSKITYHSVIGVDSYTPTTFENQQDASLLKAWSLQKPTGKVYELSMEENDSGESGLTFFMTTDKKYNFCLRFDLTQFPPQFEIFDATESANP